MTIIKKLGAASLLSFGIFFFNFAIAMDSSDDEETISLSRDASSISSNEENNITQPIKIDLTNDDFSQEDSLDEILRSISKSESPINPLKRKREERDESPSDDYLATQSNESSQGPERSESYDSEEENSFLEKGEHYGSDEGDPYETEDSRSYSDDEAFASSSSDVYEPEPKHFKKNDPTSTRLKRSKRLHPPSEKKQSVFLSSSSSSLQESENETDKETDDESLLLENEPNFVKEMVNIGLHVKLLSTVYLGNVSEKANVFLPWYKAEIELSDGEVDVQEGWFKTDKDEICVFASGGLHHIWEKNVRHVNKIFFKEQIKIIRAHWIQKHLYKNKHEATMEDEFAGAKKKQLHSEYYYNLFFRKYFMPKLRKQVRKSPGTLKSLTIHAFSWWEVCDKCEGTLSGHKELLGGIPLSYHILARKPYKINYPSSSCVGNKRIPKKVEQKAWEDLWERINHYTGKKFENSKEKREFWTKTYEGLEVCKWFGQAFSEREVNLDGRKTKGEKGSILTFYKKQQPDNVDVLEDLLDYLRDRNWDLSCWYKGPRFLDKVQPKWKRHWKQVCVPHFGWEEIHAIEKKKEENNKRKGRRPHQERQKIKFEDKEDWDGDCEMCGYEGIENVFRIFHPKYHGSEKFLKLSQEQQKEREGSKGFTYETPIDRLPSHLQKKRLQSLCVGSECVKVLCLRKSDIKEWRENKNDEDTDAKTHDQAKRLQLDDKLTKAEKELRRKIKK